jgi:hypothetical protein
MNELILKCNNLKLEEPIIDSKSQTKDWRKNQSWYKQGCKNNQCEKYQRVLFKQITQNYTYNTKERINKRTLVLKKIKNIKENNGFDWTEDFDGKVEINKKTLYINFKFVCDKGGISNKNIKTCL